MKLQSDCLACLVFIGAACAIGFAYADPTVPDTDPVLTPARSGDASIDYGSWAVDPTAPGPDLPPLGRSLFDHLVTESIGGSKVYSVPFPFSALIDRIQARLGQQEYSGGTRVVMIKLDRRGCSGAVNASPLEKP